MHPMTVFLSSIALARSGDKGSNANIGVIARKAEYYEFLKSYLTEERVASYFHRLAPKKVVRYELDKLQALNFVLVDVLEGGGSVSLRTDAQGKTLAQALLLMPIELPSTLLEHSHE